MWLQIFHDFFCLKSVKIDILSLYDRKRQESICGSKLNEKKNMHTGPNDHKNVSQIYFFLHKIEIRFKDVKSHSSSFNDNIAWLSFPTAVIAFTVQSRFSDIKFSDNL